jgi:hypothetical protein
MCSAYTRADVRQRAARDRCFGWFARDRGRRADRLLKEETAHGTEFAQLTAESTTEVVIASAYWRVLANAFLERDGSPARAEVAALGAAPELLPTALDAAKQQLEQARREQDQSLEGLYTPRANCPTWVVPLQVPSVQEFRELAADRYKTPLLNPLLKVEAVGAGRIERSRVATMWLTAAALPHREFCVSIWPWLWF